MSGTGLAVFGALMLVLRGGLVPFVLKPAGWEEPLAAIQVLSTPGCAGCAQAKELIPKLVSEFPGFECEEIDLTEEPDLAARYGIMSIPAIVMDGRLEFVGVPREDAPRRNSRP